MTEATVSERFRSYIHISKGLEFKVLVCLLCGLVAVDVDVVSC